MTQFIEVDYETLKQKRRLHVYGALVRACELHGTTAPSYKTFCNEVSRRPCTTSCSRERAAERRIRLIRPITS